MTCASWAGDLPVEVLMLLMLIFGSGAIAVAALLPSRLLDYGPFVHWLQEIAVHALFYGSAAAGLLGLKHCEPGWVYPSYIAFHLLVLGSMSLWCLVHMDRLHK